MVEKEKEREKRRRNERRVMIGKMTPSQWEGRVREEREEREIPYEWRESRRGLR